MYIEEDIQMPAYFKPLTYISGMFLVLPKKWVGSYFSDKKASG